MSGQDVDVRVGVNWRLLQDAVELTHNWRDRVQEITGGRPPTAYHRIMLYLWLNHYWDVTDEKNSIEVDKLADACGFTVRSIRKVIYAMENDRMVATTRDVTQPSVRRVALTEHGVFVAEV